MTVFSFVRTLALVFLCFLSGGASTAQEFDRLHTKSVQPVLAQPLRWVSALATAAPTLPAAFVSNAPGWSFALYTARTELPTAPGTDAWASFTVAATDSPQSWVVHLPRFNIQKVSLYGPGPSGTWRTQSAGALLAPATWSRTTRTPSFEIFTGADEKTYYMRFEHYGPITERPFLMSQLDFSDSASRMGTLIGLMLGMFGLLIAVCIAASLFGRNTVFLSLAGFTSAMLLTHLTLLGYGGWRMWPTSSHLNQSMPWAAAMLSLGAGGWFCAQASYAKDGNTLIYRLLGLTALGSLLMAGVVLLSNQALPRDLPNGWTAFVVLSLFGSLLWLCATGQRWNWWLLGGLLPMCAAATTRLAYNYGWLTHIEMAQSISVFLTQAGLLWLFLALAWRGRATLLATERAAARETFDAATGLTLPQIVKARLPALLKRANRLKMGCGVIMLRWVDYNKNLNALSAQNRAEALAQFGRILQGIARDIDTVARFSETDCMVLVEGPVNRSALTSSGTQVLSSCLRASQKAGMPGLFNVHVAIWHANDQASSPDEVIEMLSTRLNQMSYGTQRQVQFVDSASSAPAPDSAEESTLRRQDVIEKINALEATQRLPTIATPKRPRPKQ